MMADQWFLARNNKKSGPYTTAQLAELAASGHVRATDMVLAAGGQKWVQVCQVVTVPMAKPAAKPAAAAPARSMAAPTLQMGAPFAAQTPANPAGTNNSHPPAAAKPQPNS